MNIDATWLDALQLAATGLINVALATLAGCIGSLWVLRRGESAWAALRATSAHRVLYAAAAGVLLADVALLGTQTAVLTEQPLSIAAMSMGDVALTTHVGHAGVLGTAAAASMLIAGALVARLSSRLRFVVLGACLALIAAGKSWSSHAGATDRLVLFVIDWIHVLSASAWAGIVFLATYLVLRRPEPAGLLERSDCAHAVQTVSMLATWSLGGVLVTGAVSSWRALGGSLDPLFTSSYGWILLVKISLVAVAIALGAFNRWAVMPRLLASLRATANPSSSTLLRTFHNTLVLESLVFLAVLAAAAALGKAEPPTPN